MLIRRFSFDEAHIQTNDTSSDVNSVDGLVISSSGELSFDTNHATYANLVSGDIVYIDASYQVTNTDDSSVTGYNNFQLEVSTDSVNFRSTQILGQLTATDVDRGTYFDYQQVGAPVDG